MLNALHLYVLDRPKNGDLVCALLTYAYNCEIHTTTRGMRFELVLSNAPPPLALDRRPDLEDDAVPQPRLTSRRSRWSPRNCPEDDRKHVQIAKLSQGRL